ncbi:hypothetical protein EDB19DRAFT_1707128 [Suillus lakei]|nr:hypothetical protein EDB19DRAFT_1707128 [Suillus lakei]
MQLSVLLSALIYVVVFVAASPTPGATLGSSYKREELGTDNWRKYDEKRREELGTDNWRKYDEKKREELVTDFMN